MEYHLYLNNPNLETIEDIRYTHVFKKIPMEFNLVRKYYAGLDVPYKDIKDPLPYVTRNGKVVEFSDFYEEIIGVPLESTHSM